jgi:tetratricopeptide (TPR) repeat protein
MQYKKTTKMSRLIGHELGVATILEGSVRRAGTRVRIVAQLINAQTDAHLWAEAYDRELTDIFAIQSDVARQIATALKARISPSEQERLQQKPTLNLEAYNLYLQGRYFFEKRIEVTLKKALALFEEAIQKDPQYALAYTGIADTYGLLSNYGVLPSQEAFKKATEAAQKAIEIDGTLAEAQTSLAVIKSDYEWDWVGAERYFVRAIEMNPGYARARQWYALYLAITGRHDRALREIRRAQELDPLSLSIQASVGLCFLLSKNYAEAINALLKTVELDVNFAPAYLYLAWAYGQKRMYEQAVEASLQYLSLDGQSSETLESLQEAFKTSGWQGYLRARIDVLTRQGTRSRYDRPVTIAGTYLLLGEKDQALAWLEKAYEQRDSTLGFIKTHPVFEELHSDVRFIQLLRKMGLG